MPVSQGCGFAAPDGQREALSTRRLDNAARYPQLHSPSSNEGILFLAGMKENDREDCRGVGQPHPDGAKWVQKTTGAWIRFIAAGIQLYTRLTHKSPIQ
jgi:hypothetical protein